MSYARKMQGEGRTLHGGYWSAFDGNNYNNTNRKRSRHNYYHKNYNNNNDYWERLGEHNGNTRFYNADHANYVKYDAVPSSFKRRKYSVSVSTWDESWRYHIPPTFHDNVPSSCNFPAPPMRSNADTSTSAHCKHDCSSFEDEEPVFMSRDEIDRRSPSRKDGIDVLHETHLRYSYCAFLQSLGMRLEL